MWGDPTQVGQLYEPRSGASKAGVFNQGAVGLYVSTLPSTVPCPRTQKLSLKLSLGHHRMPDVTFRKSSNSNPESHGSDFTFWMFVSCFAYRGIPIPRVAYRRGLLLSSQGRHADEIARIFDSRNVSASSLPTHSDPLVFSSMQLLAHLSLLILVKDTSI